MTSGPEFLQIFVDKRVLNGFKRRALRHHPLEHAEYLWGWVTPKTVNITAIVDPGDIRKRHRMGVEFGDDQKREIGCIGSIHTHTNGFNYPSVDDIIDANDEDETVFGICYIQSKSKRRFVSWGFYDKTGKEIQLAISE